MLKAQINERESVERMAGRIRRLRKSLARAEGARKKALEEELNSIVTRLHERRDLIAATLEDLAKPEKPAAEPAAAPGK